MGHDRQYVLLRFLFSTLILAALLLGAGCSGSSPLDGDSALSKATLGKPVKPPPDPEPPAGDPAIAYFAVGGGMMVMDADGSNPFTVYSGNTSHPSWSPDGEQLALKVLQPEADLLCKINVDGSGYQVVSDELDHLYAVAWSPAEVIDRGYRVACTAGPIALEVDIWLISPEGGVAENVTNTTDAFEDSPTWSADATRLAYYSVTEDSSGATYYDIWIHDFSTDTATRVELGGVFASRDITIGDLDWARTQDKIAFEALTSEATGDTVRNGYEIWVVDLNDPANPVQLTDDPSVHFSSPSWSPDDSEIVYQKGESSAEIWKMNADGSGKILLLAPAKKIKSVSGPVWKR